jgi:hypothetical protein
MIEWFLFLSEVASAFLIHPFIHGFWTDNVENTPDAVKYKAVGKFEPNVLVWCAFSKAGVPTPFTVKDCQGSCCRS